MEKKIRLTLEENENVSPLDFVSLHEKTTKADKFCWGCKHTLYPNTKNPLIKQMYVAFRNKKGFMTDYKIAEDLADMKKKLFPEDNEPFTIPDILHHLNNHMFDLFNELHLQVEKCNTIEKQLEKHLWVKNLDTGRDEPDHDAIKSREMIVNKKILLLKELHKYRDNKVATTI